MFRWQPRKRDAAAKQLLDRLVNYNAKLIARAQDPETRRHPLHQHGVTLRLLEPAAKIDPGDSWLGGAPRLPDPFNWPQVEGQPLHFLGQIACSALPAEIWGGLGPRSGYLAFFAGAASSICATVIHSNQLGPERRAPAVWPDDFLSYDGRQTRFRELYDRMPSWRLEIAPQGSDDEDRKRSLLANGAASPDVDFQRAEFQPHDWRTLILMLECADEAARLNVQSNRKSLEDAEARTLVPKLDLALRERVAAEALAMRSHLAELAVKSPYEPDLWRPLAEQTSAWRKALTADALRVDRNLFTHFQTLRSAADELLQVCASRLASAPKLADELESVRDRAARGGLSDPELRALLQETQKEEGPAALVWHRFSEKFPAYWQRAVAEIDELYAAVADAELLLRPVEWRTYANGKPRPPWGSFSHFQNSYPTSWPEAVSFVERYVENAQSAVDHVRGSDSQQAELRERLRDLLVKSEARAEALAVALSRAEAAAKEEPFEHSLSAPELALVEADEGTELWTPLYESLRYRLTAFAYGHDSAGLPAAVKSHFEARWANDRNYEVAGMGGLPVGWSYDVLENVGDRVMLLELPTSRMIGWQWGDVNRLVIHLSVKDLEKGRFGNARAEISN
jgi:hypothetical protein